MQERRAALAEVKKLCAKNLAWAGQVLPGRIQNETDPEVRMALQSVLDNLPILTLELLVTGPLAVDQPFEIKARIKNVSDQAQRVLLPNPDHIRVGWVQKIPFVSDYRGDVVEDPVITSEPAEPKRPRTLKPGEAVEIVVASETPHNAGTIKTEVTVELTIPRRTLTGTIKFEIK